MADRNLPLNIVDGLTLKDEVRAALRPGEILKDREGRARRLPRFFYEIDSWQTAKETYIAPNFRLSELLMVDVREHPALQPFPRYVPCAVALLGAHLQVLRSHVGTWVAVAANGGYRSPSHAYTRYASTHCWGTAVNIFRIGEDLLDDQETIEKYGQMAVRLMPAISYRPYGHSVGFSDDHLHLDLGYTTVVPASVIGETTHEAPEPVSESS